MKGFPAAARETLQNAQLRRNLGKATTTIRAKRLRAISELPDWEALRDAGAAIKAHAMATLPEQLERLEASVTRARRGRALGARRGGGERDRRVDRSLAGASEVVKVKSIATDEIGLNDALEREGITRDRDRPGGAHPPAVERQDVAHPRAGDPSQPARDQGAVRAHDHRRDARHRGLGHRRGRPAPSAREVPLRARRGLGRQFRDRRDWHGRGGRVRGQRAHVHDAAAGAGHGDGDREGAAASGAISRCSCSCSRARRRPSG